MKRTQVIRITPCKKKNAKINSGRIEYFNKLSKNEIGHLLNFLDEEDQLKLIAKKIIEDFDKEHKNSEFEYHDFMKIGSWVYKNIKYNLAYSGKQQISALNI